MPSRFRSFAGRLPSFARAALVLVLALALLGLIRPTIRPFEVPLAADQVSHGILIYAATLLTALSFPRIRPMVIGAGMAALATAAEVAQLTGVIDGAAQVSDLAADAAGILLALVPLAVVRARRLARAA